MNIATDFDGVIADTGTLKSETAKKLFGISIPPRHFKSEYVVPEYLSEEQYRTLTSMVSSGSLGLTVKFMEGALIYIPILQMEGHRLSVVTSRDGEWLLNARLCAERHNLFIPFYGTGYQKSKAPALKGCDLFVDDNLEKLTDLKDTVPHRVLYSPNEHRPSPPGIVRVRNWRQLYIYINVVSGANVIRPDKGPDLPNGDRRKSAASA
ncbi:MAG: hypothetical protein KGJ13_04250 [Patescibacteria group bacterium]|nr:hypothetical protein [Patescibacteria group bacterium]